MSAEITQAQKVDRTQIAQTATGVISENGSPSVFNGTTAPTTQSVYAVLLGLRAGDVVTGVLLRNPTAAAGTLPTTARFGIADATGKILALSGNVTALASWPVGACPFALTAPYTVLADAGYYACFVVNGTWGTTQPAPIRSSQVNAFQAFGSAAPPALTWASQTDLPAVNSSLTLTGATQAYYMAFY